ncbi:hypothetical protein BDA99DRAFT_494304 [Phascolomyces articulosus]|uniref:NAD(P)-binding domain-containing protein n=1 Tax=Phascolomyces articulosus TaxID=60185 RepID=A0AAD5KAN3_9FUNG|nr:hypothetical protein BDA99DRAFT_494304 [Phascolomyces articulosus]
MTLDYSNERIFVVGGTGNIGSIVVQELVKNGAQVTVYARTPAKVEPKNHAGLTIVQGDFNDWTPLEKALPGHTRLFLLVGDSADITQTKIAIHKKAYAAGIKQIVEISARLTAWRKFRIADYHIEAEQAVYSLPERKGTAYVALRPTNFTSNLLFYLDPLKNNNTLIDTADPDEPQELISTYDIAHVAVRILGEPIEKHGDAGYDLVGDVTTPSKRAASLSKTLGRTITYNQVPVKDFYDTLIGAGLDHATAYFLSSFQGAEPVSRGLPILLGGRAPETFDTWAARNKDLLL